MQCKWYMDWFFSTLPEHSDLPKVFWHDRLGEPEIKPQTFWWADDLVNLLSYSHPKVDGSLIPAYQGWLLRHETSSPSWWGRRFKVQEVERYRLNIVGLTLRQALGSGTSLLGIGLCSSLELLLVFFSLERPFGSGDRSWLSFALMCQTTDIIILMNSIVIIVTQPSYSHWLGWLRVLHLVTLLSYWTGELEGADQEQQPAWFGLEWCFVFGLLYKSQFVHNVHHV